MDRVRDEDSPKDVDRVVRPRGQDQQDLEDHVGPGQPLHPGTAAEGGQGDENGVRRVPAEPEVARVGPAEREHALGELPDHVVGGRQGGGVEEQPMQEVGEVEADPQPNPLAREENRQGDAQEEKLHGKGAQPEHVLRPLPAEDREQRRDREMRHVLHPRRIAVGRERPVAEGDRQQVEHEHDREGGDPSAHPGPYARGLAPSSFSQRTIAATTLRGLTRTERARSLFGRPGMITPRPFISPR